MVTAALACSEFQDIRQMIEIPHTYRFTTDLAKFPQIVGHVTYNTV